MDKEKQLIMVVNGKNLFGNNGEDYFEGFMPHGRVDFESRILKNFGFMTRGSSNPDDPSARRFAELDPNYKQPIAYCMILNPELEKVFSYQRAMKDAHYQEKRLQGKWAWGVGGHIDMPDIETGNPIEVSRTREIREEVRFLNGKITDIKTLGYLHINEGVHAVHFGILYAVITDSIDVQVKGSESVNGRLRTLAELEEILRNPDYDVEGWSRTAFAPLREYFESLKGREFF